MGKPQAQLIKTTTGPRAHHHERDNKGGARLNQMLVTRVGLQIETALTFDTWERAGLKFAQITDSTAWCLGDWLIYGQSEFSDRYKRAIEAANLDYQTLRNYAWVARRFSLARRRVSLSFQHHAEVAALRPEIQDQFLDLAEAGGWSRNELRRQVRGLKTESSDSVTTIGAMRVNSVQVRRWREAAEQLSCKFEDWIMRSLDDAAARVLEPPQ